MKIFVSGANGALGREMTGLLERENIEYVGIDIDQLDITKTAKTREFLLKHRPDVILHFAAVSDVDSCEDDRDYALLVNALSCKGLAEIANEINAKMLYTSTNFVFDGNAREPYTESSKPNPINEYGRTKLLGETYTIDICQKYFIVRTSWLFGKNAKTYITRFLAMATKPESITVIRDQQASFTYIKHLSEAILRIVGSEEYGLFHIVNNGIASWFDFAKKAQSLMKFKTEIVPVKLAELDLHARRPLFSPLASTRYERLFASRMASWEEAQEEFIHSLSDES
ncbi:MAG: dTDP-4-dehydrorhamnose reductase [bacterium]